MNYTNFSINALVSTGSSSQAINKATLNSTKTTGAKLNTSTPLSSGTIKNPAQSGNGISMSPIDYRGFSNMPINSQQSSTLACNPTLPVAIPLIRANSSSINNLQWPHPSSLVHATSRAYAAQPSTAKALPEAFFKQQHGSPLTSQLLATTSSSSPLLSAATANLEHPLELFGPQAIQRIQTTVANQLSGSSSLNQSAIMQPNLPNQVSSLRLSSVINQSSFPQQRQELVDEQKFTNNRLDLSRNSDGTTREDSTIGPANHSSNSLCVMDDHIMNCNVSRDSNRLDQSKLSNCIITPKCGDESNNESMISQKSENGDDDEDDEDEEGGRRRARKTKIPKTVS